MVSLGYVTPLCTAGMAENGNEVCYPSARLESPDSCLVVLSFVLPGNRCES